MEKEELQEVLLDFFRREPQIAMGELEKRTNQPRVRSCWRCSTRLC
jgi:hypothetical protein